MLKELNVLVDFIEAHLTEEIQPQMLQKITGVSVYHLKIVFFHLTQMTISEYIKQRRLSEAAQKLSQGASVTEVAYQYGYQSLDGFTRAFKKWSGLLPSEINKLQQSKVFPKISFTITVTGGNNMEYKIIEMPDFYLAGVKKRVSMQFEGVNEEIIALAQSITGAQREEMHALKNVAPLEVVNASYAADYGFKEEKGGLTHLIGVLTTKEPKLLTKKAVSAGLWAVFTAEGPFPETMQKTMAKIYSEWLPSVEYELIAKPNFSFTKMNTKKDKFAYSEIYIPIKEKSMGS